MFHQYNIPYHSQCIREYHSLNRDASTDDFRVGDRIERVGNARFSRKVEVELSLWMGKNRLDFGSIEARIRFNIMEIHNV